MPSSSVETTYHLRVSGLVHSGESPLPFVDTVTNFVLFDLGREAGPVYEAMLKKGVIVRPMAACGLKTFLRVTIGIAKHNRRFIEALKKTTE